MNDEPSELRETRYDEQAVRRVIERALALHEQSHTGMTGPELHSLLLELGVPADLASEALANESAGAELRVVSTPAKPIPVLHLATLGLTTGSGAAVLMVLLGQVGGIGFLAPGVFALGATVSGVAAVRNWEGRLGFRFHLGNLALWAGLGAGFRIVMDTAIASHAASYGGMPISLFALFWGFCSVGGLLMNRFATPDPTSPAPGLMRRVYGKAIGVIKRWAANLQERRRLIGSVTNAVR